MYVKSENLIDLLYEFSMRQWTFDNANIRQLWLSLNNDDQHTFQFSLKKFDWKSYIECYYHGIRRHILHEDLSNVESALSKNKKYGLPKMIILLNNSKQLVVYVSFYFI